MCTSDIFLGLIAILFPPLAVWVKRGICSADSLINIALCCLGYLPGLIHAWYIIAKYPEIDYVVIPQDAEGARVTYYYVNQQPQPRHHCHPSYGTTAPSAPLPPQQSGVINQSQPSQGPSAQSNVGEGSSSGGALPSYAEAVKGDHKIQTQD